MKQILSLLLTAGCALAAAPEFGFEQNRGQAPTALNGSPVTFLTRIAGAQVFFTASNIVLTPYEGDPVTLSFPGAAAMKWHGDGAAYDHISYQVGQDRSRWVHAAPVYHRLVWRGAYPGVDVAFYRHEGQLEYDLILAPGADPARVRLQWSGAVRPEGKAIEAGAIRQQPPRLYQVDAAGRQQAVEGRFVPAARPGEYRLELGVFDRQRPLVVDPVLQAASYVGGENDDEVVAAGPGYLVGNTRSVIFPGALPARRRTRDIFVRGTGRVGQSTNSVSFTGTVITGGSGDDQATGAALGTTFGSQALLVVGTTDSRDLGSLSFNDTYRGGASDGFWASFALTERFSSALALNGIRYVGGSGEDRLNAIASNGFSAVAVGTTDSPDLATAGPADFPPAPQATLGGGRDAFYVTGDGRTGYFGGTGDDQGLAVGVFSDRFYLAGETNSPDLPNLAANSAAFQGGTDAFLAQPASLFLLPSFVPQAWYVGGKGEDRITAVSCANQSPAEPSTPLPPVAPGCVFAGVTNSPDLPVRQAAQPGLAGGTDVFAGAIDTQTGALRWLTYWGGTQDDSASAVAQNWAGDLFVAGTTRSPDLPLADQQQGYGGREDGLIAVFSNDGRALQSTYYGGSGDDRLLGVGLLADNIARWVGTTTSTDLPESQRVQPRGNGQEGFYVDLGTRYLAGPSQLTLPKDAAFALNLRSSGDPSAVLTYRSADPTRLRFVLGTRTMTELTTTAETTVRLEALAGEGEVQVTVTSPGYATKTITVRLVPGVFVMSGFPSIVSAWTEGSRLFLSAAVRALNDAGEPSGSAFSLRSGAGGPFRFLSSDNEVLRIVEGEFQATVVRPGRAVVQWEAGSWKSLPQEVRVTVPEPVIVPLVVGENLTAGLNLSFALNGAFLPGGGRGTYTARSDDPSRLMLSTSGGRLREAITFTLGNNSPGAMLHGMASSGSVRVTLTSSEWEGERVIPVTLEPAAVRFSVVSSEGLGTVREGGDAQLLASYQTASGTGAGQSLRPGAPVARFRVESGEPRVLETSSLTAVIGPPGTVLKDAMRIRGLAAGTASLRVRALDWLPVSQPELSVSVVPFGGVNPEIFGLPAAMTVGRDLQVPLGFRYFVAPQPAAEITVDDPSLAVVTTDPLAAGSGRIEGRAGSSDSYSFWVQALRGEGQTVVRVRVGAKERAVRVTLLASTLGFYPPAFEGSQTGRQVRVGMVALDEVTGAAVDQGTPRPGLRVPVNVRVESGPAAASPLTGTLDTQNPTLTVNLTNVTSPTTLVVDTPPAFPAAPLATRVEINGALAPTIVAVFPSAAGYLAVPVNSVATVRLSFAQTGRLTVTSEHPDRLLLSAAPAATPAASIEIAGDANSATFYLHGQAAGLTRLRISAGDAPPAESLVNVSRPGLLLSAGPDFFAPNTGQEVQAQFQLSPGFLGARLPTVLGSSAVPLRLGLRSSNPAVFSVPADVTLLPGQSQVTFTAKAGVAGRAELSIEAPDGVDVFAASYPITVGPPATLAALRLALGRHLQTPLRVSLPRSLPSGGIARVVSADPSKVLLSRSSAAAGSGSISVAIQPSASSLDEFYVQALGNQGEVNLTTSADGVADIVTTVVLRPSYLMLTPGTSSSVLTIPPSGLPVGVVAAFESLPVGTQPAGIAIGTLRPGMETVRAQLRSDPAGVVRNLPATVDLLPGATTQFSLQPGPSGEADVLVEAPGVFELLPQRYTPLSVRVGDFTGPAIDGGCGDMVLNRDSQVECRRSSPSAVTIRSEDPSRVVLSTVENQAGQAQITTSGSYFVQALGTFGTTELTLTAPGSPEERIGVALRPSEVRPAGFLPGSTLQLSPGGTLEFRLGLFPPGVGGNNDLRPRGGLQLPITFELTPSGVATVSPARFNFVPGFNGNVFSLRSVAPGAAVLRISADGYPAGQPFAVRVGN